MAYLGKTYKFERHEKFDEFLAALGIPKERVDAICSHESSQALEKDGDTYTLILKGHDGTKTVAFKSGEEFDEEIGKHNAKTTIAVDGNTIVQNQKFENGTTITFKKELFADKIVVTATNNAWDGVAYRYYSAV